MQLNQEQQRRQNSIVRDSIEIDKRGSRTLTNEQVYLKQTGQMCRGGEQDRDFVASSKYTDLKICENLYRGRKQGGEIDTKFLAERSIHAGSLAPEKREAYAERVKTEAIKLSQEQDQNQRPERSKHNTHDPKGQTPLEQAQVTTLAAMNAQQPTTSSPDKTPPPLGSKDQAKHQQMQAMEHQQDRER